MHLPRSVAVVLGFVALLTGAASCSDGGPTAPSWPFVRARLDNFQATQLGLTGQVCGTSFQFSAYDELTFDLKGVHGKDYFGTTVHHVMDDGTETLLGSVTQCAATVTPCSKPVSICLEPGTEIGEGTMKIWAQVPWTPVRRWNLFIRDARHDSNRVAAEIRRPDGLPYANAGILHVTARRLSNTTGSFDYVVWNPGVRDRRIFVTHEVWSNGVRLSTASSTYLELFPFAQGVGGGIFISSAPSELVVFIEERTLDGVLLATDRKTAIF